ncbi:hypothetical protein D3C73_1611080 [compost metagenome]
MVGRGQKRFAGQGLHRYVPRRAGTGWPWKKQKLEADAQFFQKAVLGQGRQVVVSPFLPLR